MINVEIVKDLMAFKGHGIPPYPTITLATETYKQRVQTHSYKLGLAYTQKHGNRVLHHIASLIVEASCLALSVGYPLEAAIAEILRSKYEGTPPDIDTLLNAYGNPLLEIEKKALKGDSNHATKTIGDSP
jgi:hypothetical protein